MKVQCLKPQPHITLVRLMKANEPVMVEDKPRTRRQKDKNQITMIFD